MLRYFVFLLLAVSLGGIIIRGKHRRLGQGNIGKAEYSTMRRIVSHRIRVSSMFQHGLVSFAPQELVQGCAAIPFRPAPSRFPPNEVSYPFTCPYEEATPCLIPSKICISPKQRCVHAVILEANVVRACNKTPSSIYPTSILLSHPFIISILRTIMQSIILCHFNSRPRYLQPPYGKSIPAHGESRF